MRLLLSAAPAWTSARPLHLQATSQKRSRRALKEKTELTFGRFNGSLKFSLSVLPPLLNSNYYEEISISEELKKVSLQTFRKSQHMESRVLVKLP